MKNIIINNYNYNYDLGIILINNKEHTLTKIQKSLFNFLIDNPDKLFTKKELMEKVWQTQVSENSISKTISNLRKIIEHDINNPTLLVTHFGKGICLQPTKIEVVTHAEKNKVSIVKIAIPILLLTVISLYFFNRAEFISSDFIAANNKDRHLIILQTNYNALDIKEAALPFSSYIESFFSNLNNEGGVIFDKNSGGDKEAINKRWSENKELILMKTNVIKNGEIYDAVIEFTNGIKTLNTIKISSPNLLDLTNQKIKIISNYSENHSLNDPQIDDVFIKAVSNLENKNYKEAKRHFSKILESNDQNHQARFHLAESLHHLYELDESLAQFEVLKQTQYYQHNSANIEINIAETLIKKNRHKDAIENLLTYQSENLNISGYKKSRVLQKLADANFYISNFEEALKFYKQSILNIDAKLYPQAYAYSYYGQASILNSSSSGNEVLELFEKALLYAKIDGNLEHQVTIMDAISVIYFFNNNWEKGLKIKREAISIMELIDDKSQQMGVGLGVLSSYLIERGLYTEASEVINRIKDIQAHNNSFLLNLIHRYYDITLQLLAKNYNYSEEKIIESIKLAEENKSLAMQLNFIFLHLELLIAREDTVNFIPIRDKYAPIFEQPNLERYKVYFDVYYAKYYKLNNDSKESIDLINKLSDTILDMGDNKLYVDTQNTLIEIYLKSDLYKATEIIEKIEKYNPNSNPNLYLKAQISEAKGQNIEALKLMRLAKESFNEAWELKHQEMLESLENKI